MINLGIHYGIIRYLGEITVELIKSNYENPKYIKMRERLYQVINQYADDLDPLHLQLAADLKTIIDGNPIIRDNDHILFQSNNKQSKKAIYKHLKIMQEIAKLQKGIVGSSIKELDVIARKLAAVEEKLKTIEEGQEIVFSKQLEISLKISETHYLILSEANELGKDNIPYYEETIYVDETSSARYALYLDLEKIIEYGRIYSYNTALNSIIEEIKSEVLFYSTNKDMRKLLKLAHRARSIIAAYHIDNNQELDKNNVSPSNPDNNKRKLVKMTSSKHSINFLRKLRLKKLQAESGSKERPVIYINREDESLNISYYKDDGFYIRVREEVKNSSGLNITDISNNRRDGIEIGCTRNVFDENAYRFPIDQTGLNFYYRRCNCPRQLSSQTIKGNLHVMIEEGVSPDSLQHKKVQAVYLSDGSVRIDKYGDNDVKNIYQSYFISIVKNRLTFRTTFTIDGNAVDISITKDLMFDTPLYKSSYRTNKWVKIGEELFQENEIIDSRLEDGLSNIRDSFDISKYKIKGSR